MARAIYWSQHTKKNKCRKNRDGKVLHKLMKNAVYGKTM